MPDTTLYVHQLQGKLPEAIERLLPGRRILHSAVARAELAVPLGFLDPRDPRTARTRATIADLLARIRPHATVAPTTDDWLEAGALAGTVARLCGLGRERRSAALNNALILLGARRAGAVLVTANVADFNPLSQLCRGSDVLFYQV